MMTTMRNLQFTLPLMALMAMGTVPGEATAQGSNTLRACLIPGTGTLYIIGQVSTPNACVRGEHIELSFNRVGPEGPAGPIGPEGAQGEAGADGEAGRVGPAGRLGLCWDLNNDGLPNLPTEDRN
jgi:hypothetical protein